jgi:hypothetical protein
MCGATAAGGPLFSRVSSFTSREKICTRANFFAANPREVMKPIDIHAARNVHTAPPCNRNIDCSFWWRPR